MTDFDGGKSTEERLIESKHNTAGNSSYGPS